jgi:hypothetical protein
MVPLQPVCAVTAAFDSSVPLVTLMFELEITEPCTLKGTVLLSAFMLIVVLGRIRAQGEDRVRACSIP